MAKKTTKKETTAELLRRLDPESTSKFEHRLEWPEDLLLDVIQKQAVRADRSMSFIIQHSWTTSHARIAASDREALEAAVRSYGGKPVKQSFYAKGAMIVQFDDEATRLGVPESLVVQAAVAFAREELEKLPVVGSD